MRPYTHTDQFILLLFQILLGPSSAVAGSGMGAPGMMGAMPPLTAGPPAPHPDRTVTSPPDTSSWDNICDCRWVAAYDIGSL